MFASFACPFSGVSRPGVLQRMTLGFMIPVILTPRPSIRVLSTEPAPTGRLASGKFASFQRNSPKLSSPQAFQS